MNRCQPPGIWVTNHLANPLLRHLLRGPAGHRLSRRLALIRYRGRRTGRMYELPMQGLTAYLRAVPQARRALGLPKQASPSPGDTEPRQISDSAVLVRCAGICAGSWP